MEPLTPRQRETLVNRINCETNSVVAGKMKVSDKTVDAHLSEVRRKLGCKTTEHAIARAIKYGIVKYAEIGLIAFLCVGGITSGELRTNRTQPRPPISRVRRQEDVC